MESELRIDKWLWAVRIYKTRSLASDACRSGRVRILEQVVKPSRMIRPGEVITISVPPIIRSFKVTGLTGNRVSAKLVAGFMEDLTPDAEYEKLKLARDVSFEFRERGVGRPTKRERREIELLKIYLGE
jgi:ribosome-associated heat shock protein Hsp15